MAHKNSKHDEDLMVRLSNHINSISLILDVVNVNSLPGGSPLENVIARQLVELQKRINHIPVISPGIPTPAPLTISSAVSAAPSCTSKQTEWMENGWRALKEMGESHNFATHIESDFYCILCARFMHSNNLLGHVRGMAHRKELGTEEYVQEEEEEVEGDEESSDDEEDVGCMVDEMVDCSNERCLEIMWDVIWAVDKSITNIETEGKRFYCPLCMKKLNGPIQVVDHVRGMIHRDRMSKT